MGSGLDRRCEHGEVSPGEVVMALENRISVEKLRACWAEAFVPDQRVVALVEAVLVPSALLTNNGPLVRECWPLNWPPSGGFDPIICSWQLRARKPAAVAFERAASLLQRSPGELLLVDDQPEATEAARANGWEALTFVDSVRLRSELAAQALLQDPQ